MSRRVFLPRPPSWQLWLLLGIGVGLYALAAVVGETYKDRHGVLAALGHDALLACSALAVGLSGFAGAAEALRDWQLRRRTGGYVLTLVSDAGHVAGRLTALTWDPARPLLTHFRDLAADHMWILLKDSDRGRKEALDRHIYVQGVDIGQIAPADPQAWSRVTQIAERNAHAAADSASSLHALALELAEYQDVAAARFLTATATLRQLTREWQEIAETAGDDRDRVGRHGLGVATLAMEPLIEVADALKAIEATTLKILGAAKNMDSVVARRVAQIAHEQKMQTAKVDHAIMKRDIAESSESWAVHRQELEHLLDQELEPPEKA